MFHVLEHLYDPRAYLIIARQLLAPDGRLVVQVPNAASWQFRLLGDAWNGVDVPRHIFDFRAGDVEKLLESCGFEVVRRKYFSLRDNPAGLASSLAPSLDPMARRVRGNVESGPLRIAKDLLYLALVTYFAAPSFTGSGLRCRFHCDDRGAPQMSTPPWLIVCPARCAAISCISKSRFRTQWSGSPAVSATVRDCSTQAPARVSIAANSAGNGTAEWIWQWATGHASYSRLDALADLTALPFRDRVFDAAIHIVTIEHLREPGAALCELARVMAPGAMLLIAAPHEWEVHQAPHDYFRYTRYGLAYLLEKAGFEICEMHASGGYFRLLARRLLNGLQFFTGGVRWLCFIPAAILLVPPALILPLLESLDRDRNFTVGYICIARIRAQ